MSKIQKIIILLVLFAITLFSVPSCAPTVPQEEYDRLNNELSEIKGQIAALQGKLAEAEKVQSQYEELSKNYEDLKKQFDTKMSEIETIESQYADLTTKYEDLKEQYDIIMEGGAEITEEDVEQAIFELVNEERLNNGLDELMWGKHLYNWGISNSRKMATNQQIEYSIYPSFQQIFWATGYTTAENIAKAALTIWKNSKQYDRIFLNLVTPYGAAAVHKSGEIFYITFIADFFE